jgi:hypothetical protein
MSKDYVLNHIHNYIYRVYGIITNVTKVDNAHYHFDLGNNFAFVLNTDAFKTDADMTVFILGLTARINDILVSA